MAFCNLILTNGILIYNLSICGVYRCKSRGAPQAVARKVEGHGNYGHRSKVS
jgi:hypothetical protein